MMIGAEKQSKLKDTRKYNYRLLFKQKEPNGRRGYSKQAWMDRQTTMSF